MQPRRDLELVELRPAREAGLGPRDLLEPPAAALPGDGDCQPSPAPGVGEGDLEARAGFEALDIELLELLFILADKTDRAFHARLHPLGE